MQVIPKDLARQVRIPAYIVTAYMALGSVLDVLVTTWPVHPHDLRWRLTFDSLITGATGTELLAVLLLLVFAWAAFDHVALAVGFGYALIAGILYLCNAVIFGLDALQVRGQITPDQMGQYQAGVVWTIGRMLFAGLMLLLLAVVALRAFRTLTRVDRLADPAGNLIVSKNVAAPNRATV